MIELWVAPGKEGDLRVANEAQGVRLRIIPRD